MGVKGSKGQPQSIQTWRMTSADKGAILALADRYGGVCADWHDAKASPPNQYQVVTKASEVRVLLPNDSLSVHYELWSGSGVARRCDGETCEVPGPDDMESCPCICYANQQMACAPHTRLTVVLPDIPFGGGWMLETKSWNAAQELPGMAALIESLQARGIVEARLRIDREERVINGRKRNYVVPRLSHAASVDEMLAGSASVGALGMAVPEERPALAAVPDWVDPTPTLGEQIDGLYLDPDDEVVDAEIVELKVYEEGSPFDEAKLFVPASSTTTGDTVTFQMHMQERDKPSTASHPSAHRRQNPMLTKLVIVCSETAGVILVDPDEFRHAVAWAVSKGATESAKELDESALKLALDTLEGISIERALTLMDRYQGRPI